MLFRIINATIVVTTLSSNSHIHMSAALLAWGRMQRVNACRPVHCRGNPAS